MYCIVSCPSCKGSFTFLEKQKTTRCPRCGVRHKTKGLRVYCRAGSASEAKEAVAGLNKKIRTGSF